MSEHTPTPWSIDVVDAGHSAQLLGAPNGFCADVIGTVYMGYAASDADAAFIVRAVNNHDALVDAVKCAKIIVEDAQVTLGRSIALSKIDTVLDALTNSEGGGDDA